MPGSMLNALPTSSGRVVARHDVRILVALEADAVAGAMDEVLAEAGVGDHLAAGRIDVLGGHARLAPHRSRSCWAAAEHVVQAAELVGRALIVVAGHPERARDVRAVALEPAADVEHDRLAGLDHPLARLVVRRGRVGTAGHDPERGLVVALARPATRGPRAAMSASVRPTSRPLATLVTTRSAAWAARRSSSISSASLIARRSDRTVEASPKAASGTTAWRRSRKVAHSRSDTSSPPSRPQAPPSAPSWISGPAVALVEQPRDDLERVFRLLPGDEVDRARPRQRCSSRAAGSSRRGTTSVARPRSGMTSIVSRSSAWARVAGQPLELGADADQQRRGILFCGSSACAREMRSP